MTTRAADVFQYIISDFTTVPLNTQLPDGEYYDPSEKLFSEDASYSVTHMTELNLTI